MTASPAKDEIETSPSIIISEDIEKKLKKLVEEGNSSDLRAKNEKYGYSIFANESSIMRDVINKMIEKYRHSPLEEVEKIFKTYRVPVGTIAALDKFIPKRERSFFIEDFILNSYEGPKTESEAELTKRPKEGTEQLPLKLSRDAFRELNKYVKGKVKESHIIRDVLNEIISSFVESENEPQSINQKIEDTFTELKNEYTIDQIKEAVNSYLEKNTK
ncbi:MAG TPA: hypothetical protein VEY70_03780 [Metabacillus sp.]|nr:hypothetical protein [Metabacillus sp.]